MSSTGGGGGVFVIENSAEDGGVIEENLVSLELVGLSLSNSRVDSDASSEVFNSLG